MRWGVSGVPLPAFVPFYGPIEAACSDYPGGFPPCFLGAFEYNETPGNTNPAILQSGADPNTGLLPDGTNAGRGIFQLTYSWPTDWADPLANAKYALLNFIAPAVQFWLDHGFTGTALIKCVGASYNAGPSGAWAGYQAGNVDKFDTDNYGTRLVNHYNSLINGQMP